MSGGSYNYTYSRVEDEYCNRMFDDELNEMIIDLVQLLRDLEWWQSDDIGEENYRDVVRKFKNKWLKNYGNRQCYENCRYKVFANNVKRQMVEFEMMEKMKNENK